MGPVPGRLDPYVFGCEPLSGFYLSDRNHAGVGEVDDRSLDRQHGLGAATGLEQGVRSINEILQLTGLDGDGIVGDLATAARW